MRLCISFAAVGAAILALTHPAEAVGQTAPGITYNAVLVSYSRVDIDGLSDAGNEFGIEGSVEVLDFAHLWGMLLHSNAEIVVDVPDLGHLSTDAGSTVLGAGVGLHRHLTDRISVFGRVGYLIVDGDAETSVDGEAVPELSASAKDDGFTISGGARTMLTERLELRGGVMYVDTGGDDDTRGIAELEYRVRESVGVFVRGSIGQDASSFGAGAALRF